MSEYTGDFSISCKWVKPSNSIYEEENLKSRFGILGNAWKMHDVSVSVICDHEVYDDIEYYCANVVSDINACNPDSLGDDTGWGVSMLQEAYFGTIEEAKAWVEEQLTVKEWL